MAKPAPAPAHIAPTNLWSFLGERKGTPFVPFPAQYEALSTIRVPWPGYRSDGVPYPSIFSINSGRRWGKTTVLEKILWSGLTAPEDEFGAPTVRVTADTEEHGRKVWDRFLWHLYNTPLESLLKSHSRERDLVTFHNDATAQLLSANNPQALAGDGVSLWVVDEAQYLVQAAWDNLFPSVSERSGVIVMAGVAEGEGPFREVCYKGDRQETYPEFLRLAYPTASNPYVSRRMIDLASQVLAPAKFRQLYMAQWVNEIGRIFRGVQEAVRERQIGEFSSGGWYCEEPKVGRSYYAGLDIAKLQDWTVLYITDRQGSLVAWDTFSLISWEQQKARIATLSRRYNLPYTCVDTTGIGDPIYDELARTGLNVSPYQISSNAKKVQLVDNLAIRLGAGSLTYPRVRELVDQLERFEARKSRTENSNVIRYEAPAGMHDDWVMAMALLAWVLPRFDTDALDDLADATERHAGIEEAYFQAVR